MRLERRDLPQAFGRLFLTDAGLHNDADLRGGLGAREFVPHALLAHSAGRYALARYFRSHLSAARGLKAGFVLDGPTAKAHIGWARELGSSERDLERANRAAVDFVADLRDEFFSRDAPIVLNGVIARCDGERLGATPMTAAEAADYHARQLGWLADTEVDMVTASGFAHAPEAIGLVSAARKAAMPIVLSFAVGVDGLVPGGRTLGDLIAEIDAATRHAAAYYTVDYEGGPELCAVLDRARELRRVKGLRCTAWSHGPPKFDLAAQRKQRRERAERAAPPEPQRLLELYRRIMTTMPWVNVVGGDCR